MFIYLFILIIFVYLFTDFRCCLAHLANCQWHCEPVARRGPNPGQHRQDHHREPAEARPEGVPPGRFPAFSPFKLCIHCVYLYFFPPLQSFSLNALPTFQWIFGASALCSCKNARSFRSFR